MKVSLVLTRSSSLSSFNISYSSSPIHPFRNQPHTNRKRGDLPPNGRTRFPGQSPNNIFEHSLEKVQNRVMHDSLQKTSPEIKDSHLEEINSLGQELFEQNLPLAVDEATKAHMRLATVILSSYKVLSRDFSHPVLMDAFQESLYSHLHSTRRIAQSPLILENPLPLLSTLLGSTARLRGRGFTIELQDDFLKSFLHGNVKRCFFHEFFTTHNVSFLTSLFCNAERFLFADIDPEKVNLKFRLNGTLANGDEYCGFHFNRTEPLRSDESEEIAVPSL